MVCHNSRGQRNNRTYTIGSVTLLLNCRPPTPLVAMGGNTPRAAFVMLSTAPDGYIPPNPPLSGSRVEPDHGLNGGTHLVQTYDPGHSLSHSISTDYVPGIQWSQDWADN